MKLVDQKSIVLFPITKDEAQDQLTLIEYAGRNCYRSQDKMNDDSNAKFIRMLIKNGHEAPIEFGHMTFELMTSRAVMAELTRHRLMSFCIESQRYVNYNNGGLTFVRPEFFGSDQEKDRLWLHAMTDAENNYEDMEVRSVPQEAREVLPNSTACKIVVSANLREWRHFFELRCSPAAYPQMRTLACDMLKKAYDLYPVVFEDLYRKYMFDDEQ